jgi:hypothetical protein
MRWDRSLREKPGQSRQTPFLREGSGVIFSSRTRYLEALLPISGLTASMGDR